MLLRRNAIIYISIEIFFIIMLLLLYVFRGELHVDEAGYVYAAREIAGGLVPYHDFLFLQTPVFPYVFAIPFAMCAMTFTMSRLYMMLFGIGTILLCIILSYRFGGYWGAVLAGFLFLATPFQLQFFSIARNYPLATFWLCSGLIFVTTKTNNAFTRSMAMVFFCLSMATRLTLLPVPVLYIAYLFLVFGLWSRSFLLPLFSAVLTNTIIFYPFISLDPHRFFYNIIGFHLDISVGSLISRLLLKVVGISVLSASYFLLLILFVFSLVFFVAWRNHPLRTHNTENMKSNLYFILSLVIIIGLGQFSARFFQASYQAVLFPLVVIVITAFLSPLDRLCSVSYVRTYLLCIMILIGGIILAAHGRSGFVYDSGTRDIRDARIIARYFKEHTNPDDVILSVDSTLIPFMADRKVMKHCVAPEYYPFWSDERVEYLGIFNHRLLKRMIDERIPDVLLMSSLSFSVIMPYRTLTPANLHNDLWRRVKKNYKLLKSFPNVLTPGAETLIYVRKDDESRESQIRRNGQS